MKLLTLVLGILLCQASNVSCSSFYDDIVSKISEYVHIAVSTFRDIGTRIKYFIYGNTEPVHSQAVPKQRDNVRSVYLERTKDTSETEKAKYTHPATKKPTISLSTPQLAALHGKKIESHVIGTEDGYLLTLHRIAIEESSIDKSSKNATKTILLHHGLLGSSADWILLGPEKSLPYILSSAGYDVWMINTRGNYYSRGHLEMNVDGADYWRFSFHEIGIYDIPATLEYIRKVKNCSEKIDFIGHSMGASALLVLLSTHQRYNDYFRTAIFIAPLVFMTNIEGPLKISSLSNQFGDGEFLPHRKVPNTIALTYCKGSAIYCTNPLFFLCGIPQFNSWSDTFVSTLFYHVPAGGSKNTILHYQQMAASGKFHKFGDANSEYPLHEVTLPISIISSSEDWLSTIPDVLRLYYSIKVPIDNYVIHGRNISHTEFVWGSKAHILIFPRVLEYLEGDLNYTTTLRNEI